MGDARQTAGHFMSLTVSGAGGQDAVLLQLLQQALAARQADAGTTSGSSTGNNKTSTNTIAAIDLSGSTTVPNQLLAVITQIAGIASSSGDGGEGAKTIGVGAPNGAAGAGGAHHVHAAGGDGDGDADDGVTNSLQSIIDALTGTDNDTSSAGASSTASNAADSSTASGSAAGNGLQALVAALQAYAENSGWSPDSTTTA